MGLTNGHGPLGIFDWRQKVGLEQLLFMRRVFVLLDVGRFKTVLCWKTNISARKTSLLVMPQKFWSQTFNLVFCLPNAWRGQVLAALCSSLNSSFGSTL